MTVGPASVRRSPGRKAHASHLARRQLGGGPVHGGAWWRHTGGDHLLAVNAGSDDASVFDVTNTVSVSLVMVGDTSVGGSGFHLALHLCVTTASACPLSVLDQGSMSAVEGTMGCAPH
jgi:hypothetical protein